ncbi:unnamed protein product [Strongylus vulgaris]|uniref:Uncharacterized protein n=1 Tax=Strongylus vulgaris TaxID=40348 RepID=A0A3P7ILV9_STRVU|nr:unnamed protein product [Strongylus vulgaris]
MVTSEMCNNPSNVMPCELMGKLSLEYTRQKIMELRVKSNCLGLDTSSEATEDEKCALLEDLPEQSVKLATVRQRISLNSLADCQVIVYIPS